MKIRREGNESLSLSTGNDQRMLGILLFFCACLVMGVLLTQGEGLEPGARSAIIGLLLLASLVGIYFALWTRTLLFRKGSPACECRDALGPFTFRLHAVPFSFVDCRQEMGKWFLFLSSGKESPIHLLLWGPGLWIAGGTSWLSQNDSQQIASEIAGLTGTTAIGPEGILPSS